MLTPHTVLHSLFSVSILAGFLPLLSADGAQWTSQDLPLNTITQGWGQPARNATIEQRKLTLNGVVYPVGIGTHANCHFTLKLDGHAERLTGIVGLDDETGSQGGFQAKWLDVSGKQPKLLWQSGPITPTQRARSFDIPLDGLTAIRFEANQGDNNIFDHVDLTNLKITYDKTAPKPLDALRHVHTKDVHWDFHAILGYPLSQSIFGLNDSYANQPAIIEYPHPLWDTMVLDDSLRVIQADGSFNLKLNFQAYDAQKTDDNVTKHTFHLVDPAYPVSADLVITAYHAENVFASKLILRNTGKAPIRLLQRDAAFVRLPSSPNATLMTFTGEWGSELCHVHEDKIPHGILKHQSHETHRNAWPEYPGCFVGFDGPLAEETGRVFAAAIAWSGNWQYKLSQTPDGRLFFSGGTQGQDMIRLQGGETYSSPEIIMTFSQQGVGQASRNFHDFGRRHYIRNGLKQREIILNSWEGCYFTFTEDLLLKMMDGARELGVERFVLDDGWFGNGNCQRNSDAAGLGDWQVNRKKLPHGIDFLIDEAEKRGLKFGIWVEPEMVNPQSELFKRHPDWAMKTPRRQRRTMRKQYTLDLSIPEVADFVYQSVADLLTAHPRIGYVKWDHNAGGYNVGNIRLGENQGALSEKITAAYYRIMARLQQAFPQVTFQLCASGGGRTDMGAMHYSDEFWASDETNALKRVLIQWGWNHFFPTKTIASHIGRYGDSDFKFRSDVAMTGRLGVELFPKILKHQDRDIIRQSIAVYKTIRPLLHAADLYRGRNPHQSKTSELTFVSKDKSQAVFFAFKCDVGARTENLRMSGLNPEDTYAVKELNPDSQTPPRIRPGTFTGRHLMRQGIAVVFPAKHASAVIAVTRQPN